MLNGRSMKLMPPARAQAQAAAASEQTALESRQAALSARLAAAHDLAEIATLITDNEADLTDAASQGAWARLADSGTIEPTHDSNGGRERALPARGELLHGIGPWLGMA
jgi:hypothetical protein